MKRVILYVACSIDGYIARPDGSLGEGIRLFPDKPKETKLILTGSNSFPRGITNLTYEKL